MPYEVGVMGYEHIQVSDEEADSPAEAERIAAERSSFRNVEDTDVTQYEE